MSSRSICAVGWKWTFMGTVLLAGALVWTSVRAESYSDSLPAEDPLRVLMGDAYAETTGPVSSSGQGTVEDYPETPLVGPSEDSTVEYYPELQPMDDPYRRDFGDDGRGMASRDPLYDCGPGVLKAEQYPVSVPMADPCRQPFDPGARVDTWPERWNCAARSGTSDYSRSGDSHGRPAGSCYGRPATVSSFRGGQTNVNGECVPVRDSEGLYAGFYVPDGRGGYVFIGDRRPLRLPDQRSEQGREIVLQIRELADQLFAPLMGQSNSGVMAIPTSFVNLDDFSGTSSFGRLMAEQMFYECNTRGIPAQEYRMTREILLKQREGEFTMARDSDLVRKSVSASCVITGTYYFDRDNVIVNARLFKLETGLVLTTGMIVIPQTTTVRKMLARRTG
ncbi:MAG: hypothetical protein EOM25_14550, partial [Deltaproteobacteria bacterium]|nr:hypothetical protein [Deltaproteobacteria bacterium]